MKAEELGICGWVANRPDGSVHVEAEAEEANLAQFREWLKHGPPAARVATVDVVEVPAENFQGFEIR